MYRSITVLTGAGISAESGLGTFRAAGGLWENHRVEDVATPEAYARDPALVHRFYNARRRQLLDLATQPNRAHHALASLAQRFGGDFTLVTQNIDNLHERGGSDGVLHMHGELLKVVCTTCDSRFEVDGDIDPTSCCDACGSVSSLRPDIVWFGEMPKHMDEIEQCLLHCDLFIAIGTSGHVYPAAGFVEMAARAGAQTVELNLEPSRVQSAFDQCIYGKAGETLPQYIEEILAHNESGQ